MLAMANGTSALYVDPPDPDDALWVGAAPSLAALEETHRIAVRPLEELRATPEWATLPPQDASTAHWLSTFLGRGVEESSGDELDGIDAALADAVIAVRLRHDDAALEQLRLAARVTEAAHRAGMASTRAGDTEATVRAAMEGAIIARDMAVAYSSIVTVRGEILHNQTYHRVLRDGDLVLADVGAETKEGWAGDVTRVWPVSGQFSGTQRALYEVVFDAQTAAIDAVRPGVRFLDVHRAAGRRLTEGLVDLGILRGEPSDLYERGAAALFFPHGVGHLLGLDVHDMEDLGDRAGYAPGRTRSQTPGDRYLRLDRDLEPGMVVTIEPGYYRVPALLDEPLSDLESVLDRNRLAQFDDVRGIRIEDDVLVTESGCEVMTQSIPKTLEDVEAARAEEMWNREQKMGM